MKTSSYDTHLELSGCESLVSEISNVRSEHAVNEEVKLKDTDINGFILIKIPSKKWVLVLCGTVEVINYTLDECTVTFLKKKQVKNCIF